jgi:hypothetical protein
MGTRHGRTLIWIALWIFALGLGVCREANVRRGAIPTPLSSLSISGVAALEERRSELGLPDAAEAVEMVLDSHRRCGACRTSAVPLERSTDIPLGPAPIKGRAPAGGQMG